MCIGTAVHPLSVSSCNEQTIHVRNVSDLPIVNLQVIHRRLLGTAGFLLQLFRPTLCSSPLPHPLFSFLWRRFGSPCLHVTNPSLPRRPCQFWAVLVSSRARSESVCKRRPSVSSPAPVWLFSEHLPTQLRMFWHGHTMITLLSVQFAHGYLPSSEPERKRPSCLGVAIVDVVHQGLDSNLNSAAWLMSFKGLICFQIPE